MKILVHGKDLHIIFLLVYMNDLIFGLVYMIILQQAQIGSSWLRTF